MIISCEKDDDFNESLLYGKWESGTLYYKYNQNHTGASWDTKDDVTEDEAQGFKWSLVKSELSHIHTIQMGGGAPEVVTVTTLTSTTLKFNDGYDYYSFTKVK